MTSVFKCVYHELLESSYSKRNQYNKVHNDMLSINENQLKHLTKITSLLLDDKPRAEPNVVP